MPVPTIRDPGKALLALALWATGSTGIAHAQNEVYAVVVAGDDVPLSVVGGAESAVRQALARIEGTSIASADARYRGLTPELVDALDQARRRLGTGRQAYLDLDFA